MSINILTYKTLLNLETGNITDECDNITQIILIDALWHRLNVNVPAQILNRNEKYCNLITIRYLYIYIPILVQCIIKTNFQFILYHYKITFTINCIKLVYIYI